MFFGVFMLRYLKTNKAQAVMGEYVMVFFLVVAMVTAMTIYFRRAVQARMHDARNVMINTVLDRSGTYFTGNILAGYEPYYANTVSEVWRSEGSETRLLEGGSSGIFQKDSDESTRVTTQSQTAPPKDAN